MKLFLLIMTITFFTLMDYKETSSQNKIEDQILRISINGLVCDFCARSIEKIFTKNESVDSINVNLEKMLITINLKKGKNLNDDIIRQLIKDSGYDVTEINRDS